MTPDEWLKALAVEAEARFPQYGFVFLSAPLDENVITCTSAGCNVDQARTFAICMPTASRKFWPRGARAGLGTDIDARKLQPTQIDDLVSVCDRLRPISLRSREWEPVGRSGNNRLRASCWPRGSPLESLPRRSPHILYPNVRL